MSLNQNDFTVDVISDLNLKSVEDFNWDGKSTSLFCVIAGNISDDLMIVKDILVKLSKIYRGVFYIDGYLEHKIIEEYQSNVKLIHKLCKHLKNVVFLHNHVVIVNGIAFVACNGWFNKKLKSSLYQNHEMINDYRIEDISYLSNTIKSLQLHKDAKKIIIISSSTPTEQLFYRTDEELFKHKMEPGLALVMDTEYKVSTWIFGGNDLMIDTNINGRRYVNNPYVEKQPYWPKRVTI